MNLLSVEESATCASLNFPVGALKIFPVLMEGWYCEFSSVGSIVVSKMKIHFEQVPVKVVKKILADAVKKKQSAETNAVAPVRKHETRA